MWMSQGADSSWMSDGKIRFGMVRNHLLQLYSLQQVTKLWLTKQKSQNYTSIIFSRPDVFYFKKLDINGLDLIQKKDIYIPPFTDAWGWNDRFALASPYSAQIYGQRLHYLKEFSSNNPLHSERFLRFTLDKYEIRVRSIDIVFERVRSNGLVHALPYPSTRYGIEGSRNWWVFEDPGNAYLSLERDTSGLVFMKIRIHSSGEKYRCSYDMQKRQLCLFCGAVRCFPFPHVAQNASSYPTCLL